MKIKLPTSFDVAQSLSNNQALDVMSKVRKAYGDEWSVTCAKDAEGKFTVSIRHVPSYVNEKLNPERFAITTIRKARLK